MSIRPKSSWFMTIDKSDEKQILYYAEKPRGKYKEGEKEPSFLPLIIELPTRIMESTEKWILLEDEHTLKFEHVNLYDDRLIDWFVLRDAVNADYIVRRSKVVNNHIIGVTLKFKGVENATL